jgi:hypothetical protein
MARLADFQTPAIPQSFGVDQKLMDRKAKAAGKQNDWRNTAICCTEGAIESTPAYMRDAVPMLRRHKRMHAALDRMIADADVPEAHDKRMHDALDAQLDEGGENPDPYEESHVPSAEEKQRRNETDPESEEEEESPEEENAAMDAVRHLLAVLKDSDVSKMANDVLRDHARQRSDGRIVRGHKPKVGHSAGYIADSAFIARHLNPNQLCSDAFQELHPRAYAMQENNALRGYWAGLEFLLKSAPTGAKVKHLNQAALSTLISKTLGAAN